MIRIGAGDGDRTHAMTEGGNLALYQLSYARSGPVPVGEGQTL